MKIEFKVSTCKSETLEFDVDAELKRVHHSFKDDPVIQLVLLDCMNLILNEDYLKLHKLCSDFALFSKEDDSALTDYLHPIVHKIANLSQSPDCTITKTKES